jgi:hypothetical protein
MLHNAQSARTPNMLCRIPPPRLLPRRETLHRAPSYGPLRWERIPHQPPHTEPRQRRSNDTTRLLLRKKPCTRCRTTTFLPCKNATLHHGHATVGVRWTNKIGCVPSIGVSPSCWQSLEAAMITGRMNSFCTATHLDATLVFRECSTPPPAEFARHGPAQKNPKLPEYQAA